MKEKLIGGALGLVVAFAVLGVYVKDRDAHNDRLPLGNQETKADFGVFPEKEV